MSAALQPFRLDAGRRNLFAVYHAPAGAPRAGVLVFGPLLHEHALSYRLFALLGDALAEHGVAVLRFDYHGSGDSPGADEEFTLAGASEDARIALDELRRRVANAPIAALGVRAGALIVARCAGVEPFSRIWLWQPIADGGAYLAGLSARDRAERRSKLRFPNGGGLKDGEPGNALLGFRCGAELIAELASASIGAPAADVVLEPESTRSGLDAKAHVELPESISSWAARVDMGHFPLPPVRDVARKLVASLGIA